MQLKEYLVKFGIVHGFFAKKIGVTSVQLSHWTTGRARPRLEMIVKLEEETNGHVTPKDWVILTAQMKEKQHKQRKEKKEAS